MTNITKLSENTLVKFRVTPVVGHFDELTEEAFQAYLDQILADCPDAQIERRGDYADVTVPSSFFKLT